MAATIVFFVLILIGQVFNFLGLAVLYTKIEKLEENFPQFYIH